MSNADDERLMLELACLTEDRAPVEQRAMLALAARLDRTFNAQTVVNKRGGSASRLYALVIDTALDPKLTKAQADTLAKLTAHADSWDAAGGRSPYNGGKLIV